MILVGYTWTDVAINMLWVSLAILVLVIGYKRLLRLLRKNPINKEDYCELYSLEYNPAKGEIPFYFTSSIKRDYSLWILDENMDDYKEVVSQECKVGGNIVRFDSTLLPNGNYFYCLKTENQKVVKKMRVENPKV